MDQRPQTLIGDEPLSEDRLQQRRAWFAVIVAGVGSVAAAGMAIQFFTFGEPFMSGYMAAAAVLYLVTWILYGQRRYRQAPLYLAVAALAAMSLANLFFLSREAGDHQFLLLVAALTPLAVHSRDRARAVMVTVLATSVFVAVEYLDWRRPFEVPVSASQAGQYRSLAVALTIVFMVSMIVHIDKRLREAQEEARRQHMRSESLLRNTLPTPIVERLKKRVGPIAERRSDVSVLFADLVGFTALARDMRPEQLVNLLNDLFSAFDTLAESLGLEKIKTIGDSYMLAGGVPTPREDHAYAVAEMALGMRDMVAESADRLGRPLNVRIGIHTGDVIAGVIGHRRFAYDLWGETVNTAARMESHGLPGKIQISGSTMELIRDRFCVERRGPVEIKGMGLVETWLLEGPSGARDAGACQVPDIATD